MKQISNFPSLSEEGRKTQWFSTFGKLHFLALSAVIFSGCSSAGPVSGTSHGASILTADPAYKLYAVKCGSCHQPYAPQKFPLAEWPEILDDMIPKARLNDAEKQEVTQFVQRHAS